MSQSAAQPVSTTTTTSLDDQIKTLRALIELIEPLIVTGDFDEEDVEFVNHELEKLQEQRKAKDESLKSLRATIAKRDNVLKNFNEAFHTEELFPELHKKFATKQEEFCKLYWRIHEQVSKPDDHNNNEPQPPRAP